MSTRATNEAAVDGNPLPNFSDCSSRPLGGSGSHAQPGLRLLLASPFAGYPIAPTGVQHESEEMSYSSHSSHASQGEPFNQSRVAI
jgi:hypothetical protein